MAWRSVGSLSRSISSAARSSSIRSSPPLPRIRRPTTPSRQSRRFLLSPSRNFRELGCAQSLLPLHGMSTSAHLASRFNSKLRAFCELSHVAIAVIFQALGVQIVGLFSLFAFGIYLKDYGISSASAKQILMK